MNRPSNAREALIAEAIGDMAQLLDRLESAAPKINAARNGLSQASHVVAAQSSAFLAADQRGHRGRANPGGEARPGPH